MSESRQEIEDSYIAFSQNLLEILQAIHSALQPRSRPFPVDLRRRVGLAIELLGSRPGVTQSTVFYRENYYDLESTFQGWFEGYQSCLSERLVKTNELIGKWLESDFDWTELALMCGLAERISLQILVFEVAASLVLKREGTLP